MRPWLPNSLHALLFNKVTDISNIGLGMALPHTITRKLIFGAVFLGILGVVGCDSPNSSIKEDENAVTIKEDEVILTKQDIWVTQPERYQPSYNLYGVLVPIAQATIVAPTTAKITSFLVQDGDWVKPQQDLLYLSAKTSTSSEPTSITRSPPDTMPNNSEAVTTKFDNRVPPSIADSNTLATNPANKKLTEVTKTVSQELESLEEDILPSDTINTSNPADSSVQIESQSDTNQLIIKAPFAGEVSELITSTEVKEQH